MSFDPTAVSFFDPSSIAQLGGIKVPLALLWRAAESMRVLYSLGRGGSIARLTAGNAATAELSGDCAVAEAGVLWADGFFVPRWGGALTCERNMLDGMADRSCDRAFGQRICGWLAGCCYSCFRSSFSG